jgi:SAM-dependent methyltransferase
VDTSSAVVSEYDVEIAYELMLGRSPENSVVVANHLKNVSSRRELRALFMASQEYRDNTRRDLGIVTPTTKPLNWPKNDIEVDVLPKQLAAMIRHVEGNWAQLGQEEPHWSVLTADRFKASEIGANIDEFYKSGSGAVSLFTHAADRAGANYRGLQRCFELGCGVGRLTVWLARIFPEVIAADISAPHLRLAAEAVQSKGLANVDLHLLNTVDKIKCLPDFDCFFSVIVLQHNPPPVMAFLLRTILEKLRPGGLAYFQLPTHGKSAVFKADKYLKDAPMRRGMEMHVLPQAVVWRIASDAGCQVLDVREDNWTGMPSFVSNSILLSKRA